jgi:hypothetical protein
MHLPRWLAAVPCWWLAPSLISRLHYSCSCLPTKRVPTYAPSTPRPAPMLTQQRTQRSGCIAAVRWARAQLLLQRTTHLSASVLRRFVQQCRWAKQNGIEVVTHWWSWTQWTVQWRFGRVLLPKWRGAAVAMMVRSIAATHACFICEGTGMSSSKLCWAQGFDGAASAVIAPTSLPAFCMMLDASGSSRGMQKSLWLQMMMVPWLS